MSTVYFRFINNRYINNWRQLYFSVEYEKIIKDELWSDFEAQWDMIDFANTTVKNEDYVLCVLYQSRDDLGSFTDFQFGVTETFKIKSFKDKHFPEENIQAFDRSLGEELGLYYYSWKPPVLHETSRNMILSSVNIKDTKLNTYSRALDKRKDFRDISGKKIKIGTIVYGTELEIKRYLNTNKIYLDSSEDKIAGIVAVKFEDIKNYFRTALKPPPGLPYRKKQKRSNVKYFTT